MIGRPDEVLDPTVLDRLTRLGGQAFLIEMIELFLEHAPRRLRSARKALKAGDANGVYLAAHSLKSTAGNLGAHRMQRTAERLEERARNGDLEAAESLLEDLDRRYEPLRGRLEAEVRRRQ